MYQGQKVEYFSQKWSKGFQPIAWLTTQYRLSPLTKKYQKLEDDLTFGGFAIFVFCAMQRKPDEEDKKDEEDLVEKKPKQDDSSGDATGMNGHSEVSFWQTIVSSTRWSTVE